MSFSMKVKEELLRVKPEKPCCMLSELSAMTQSCATLRLSGGGRMKAVYEVENPKLAQRILILLKKRLEITPTLGYTRYARLGGRRTYLLTVGEGDCRRLLVALRMIRESEEGDVFRGVPRAAETRRCCRAAFTRGAFLGAGSISDPEKGYHLEFVSSPNRAETLIAILGKSDIRAAATTRRNAQIVYIKRGDDVISCLALMGAHRSLMEMENIRIRRDGRNQANRARNCDEANLKKQLSVGSSQAESITAYSLKYSLAGLPKELQEIGRIRMLHPEASLEDLGQMLEKPIGKSGAQKRLARLMRIIQADAEAAKGGPLQDPMQEGTFRAGHVHPDC